MKQASPNTTKLLLHACCGPCSMEPVRLLRKRAIEPHVFYSNSNIEPADEYARRRDTIASWASSIDLALTEDIYDTNMWKLSVERIGNHAIAKYGLVAEDGHSLVEGRTQTEEEQACALALRKCRCRACYRLRFERAAQWAAKRGYTALGSTLSVSPYQYTTIIQEELERACAKYGIDAFFEDYRPYYNNATQRSRDAGMYRQNYCGWHFSAEEAQAEREERKRLRKRAQAERKAASEAARQKQAAAQQQKKEQRAAYDAKQARKRAVKQMLRKASNANHE